MIYYGMNEAEYRSLPALSGTGCAEIMKSPAHFQLSLAGREETPAMALGTAAHKWILEGEDAFNAAYVRLCPCGAIKKDAVICLNPGKAYRESPLGREFFCGVHAPKDAVTKGVISSADDWQVNAMAAAVASSPVARSLLFSSGQSEVSIVATDPETGCKVKGRIDRLPDSGEMLVDLKTTADAMKWKPDDYLLQACHYLAICKISGLKRFAAVAFVVVETSAPFTVRTVTFDVQALEVGEARVREAWNIYARCMESNEWPPLNRGLEVASLSAWSLK